MRRAGMTVGQWVVLVVMLLVACGAVGSFAYLVYINGL